MANVSTTVQSEINAMQSEVNGLQQLQASAWANIANLQKVTPTDEQQKKWHQMAIAGLAQNAIDLANRASRIQTAIARIQTANAQSADFEARLAALNTSRDAMISGGVALDARGVQLDNMWGGLIAGSYFPKS